MKNGCSFDRFDALYQTVQSIDQKQDIQLERLTKLEMHVEVNTRDLAEHIEGVRTAKILIEQNKQLMQQQIDELKQPQVFVKLLGKIFAYTASVFGAIYAVYQVFQIIIK